MQIDLCGIEMTIEGEVVSICPVLVRNNGFHLLIDCGYEESFEELVECLQKFGVGVEQLDAILITHDDIDHLGALALFKENNPTLKVYAGAIEAPSISGQVVAERLLQARDSLSIMPEAYLPWAKRFIERLEAIRRVSVDVVLSDGEEVIDGLILIHTPGHTKGHVSLFETTTRTLITADALVIENSQFNIANPEFTLDLPAAIQSVQKLRQLAPTRVICYHGGSMDTNIDQQFAAVLQRYQAV